MEFSQQMCTVRPLKIGKYSQIKVSDYIHFEQAQTAARLKEKGLFSMLDHNRLLQSPRELEAEQAALGTLVPHYAFFLLS